MDKEKKETPEKPESSDSGSSSSSSDSEPEQTITNRKDAAVKSKAKVKAKAKATPKFAGAGEQPPKKSANSSVVFVLGVCFWGLFTANKFYGICYPTFENVDEHGNEIPMYKNAIPEHADLSVEVYLSEKRIQLGEDTPIWTEDFQYSFSNFTQREKTIPIEIPEKIINQGSNLDIWALVFDRRENAKKKKKGGYANVIAYAKGGIIKYIKPPVVPKKFKLISGEQCPEKNEISIKMGGKPKLVRGIPKMQLRYVVDQNEYPHWMYGSKEDFHVQVFVDEFWISDDQLITFNKTKTNNYDLLLTFDLMSMARYRFQRHMTYNLEENAKMLGEDSEEILQMRDLFASTHPYLLILTFMISFLHLIFEFLAFKSDVQFFNSVGVDDLNKFVSINSIGIGIIFQILLLMYLWDESANFLVLITSLAAIGVDCWKVWKALKIEIGLACGWFPYLYFVSRSKIKKTDDFDSQAMKYLTYLLTPALIGYALYSLNMDCHKGWYSYTLAVCASIVYSLGFVLMTPQLFINYKYKTVQFLPWRRFIYRAINTFIDDLFSFIIRMPTMHRLSCFRDDVVFIIYLYQRHIYPVDKNRIFDEDGNELDTEEEEKKKDK